MKEVSSMKDISRKSGSGLKREFYMPIISFFLTFILILAAYGMNDIIPLGLNSILGSDLKAQYAPNLIRLKHHLRELDFNDLITSFTYDKTLGGGKNFMATFGYYMGSPLNILILLVPDHLIGLFVSIMAAFKVSLGSAFMCIFLEKRASQKGTNWPLLFSITYAFSSFIIIYMFNILWLDGYALLPLILYFVEVYMEKKKKAGLIITLLWLFVSNFYIAYMVGAFSFFYIVFRYIKKVKIDKTATSKEAVNSVLKFILTAICCILTVGVVLIPVGLDVLKNGDVTKYVADTNVFEFKVVDFADQLFLGNAGAFENLKDNLPYIFVSVAVTCLITIFFISKVFDKKEKIYYGSVLVLMFISFAVSILNLVWHAFDVPNWFKHRFAFVFIPVLLVLAMEVIFKIKEVTNKELLKASGILGVLLIVAQSFGDMGENDKFLALNIFMIAAYMLLFAGYKIEKWPEQLKNMNKLLGPLIALFVVFETAGLGPRTCGGMSTYGTDHNEAVYELNIKAVKGLFEAAEPLNSGKRSSNEIKEFENKDKKFLFQYECEVESITGTNSLELFDSSSNKKFSRFMKQLGFASNYNYFVQSRSYSSLPTDAFMSVGNIYMFGDYTNSPKLGNDGAELGYNCYGNEDVLDIGFAASKTALDFDYYGLEKKTTDKDYFKFQNEWYKSLFPENFTEDFYKSGFVKAEDVTAYNASNFPVDKFSFKLTNAFPVDDSLADDDIDIGGQSKNAYYRSSDSGYSVIVAKYKAPATGEQYFSIVSTQLASGATIFVNAKKTAEIASSSYHTSIIRLGYYEEGDDVEVTIVSEEPIFSYLDLNYAALDADAFKSQLATVDRSSVVTDRYDNGNIVFTTNLKDGDMLLTSIPYEDGWTCYVDGKETAITPYQDATIAVDCGSGNHKVELKFKAPGVKAGALMTAAGVVSIIALAAYDMSAKRKQKK